MKKIMFTILLIIFLIAFSGCQMRTETKASALETEKEITKVEVPENTEGDSAEVTLAKCLTEKGVKLYTASWCGHCKHQKEAFKDGLEYLDNTECALDDGWAQECTDAGVKAVPTWIFADGTVKSGDTPLSTLANLTDCPY